ncbi:hypothetical protein VMCG_09110 [Cytospora schulzeri]|uniref:Uncharacterized protein n=1 Tax=Cytospora schulzeri TaxID=448051 RepID=A0A423VN45_9PEZI|nr:hypothetical protein VMCG_09110 [Valsa malicola]
MSQTETRKYQLFPKDNQAMASQRKGLDPEQAFALAMGQNGDKVDKPCMGSLRSRMRDNLSRRRKASVTDLGPMTTVHEATIDSRDNNTWPASLPRTVHQCSWKRLEASRRDRLEHDFLWDINHIESAHNDQSPTTVTQGSSATHDSRSNLFQLPGDTAAFEDPTSIWKCGQQ